MATCIARAWPVGESPFVVAPAMNTAMWNHPVTDGQIRTLRGWGVTFVGPVVKKLACGDTGIGAMATPEEIVLVVEEALQSSNAAKNSTSSAAVVE